MLEELGARDTTCYGSRPSLVLAFFPPLRRCPDFMRDVAGTRITFNFECAASVERAPLDIVLLAEIMEELLLAALHAVPTAPCVLEFCADGLVERVQARVRFAVVLADPCAVDRPRCQRAPTR
jgi:hypothetical protein